MLRSALCRLVVPSAALLLALPAVAAQDAESLFENGVAAFEAGDTQVAIDAFKDALAQNPGHQEAFRLWQRLEQDKVMQMLTDGGELGALARRFLGLARIGRDTALSDPGSARDVVERYLTGDVLEAQRALLELSGSYGEWAVPALLGPLADRSDSNRQVLAIAALVRLGDRAVPPLLQALQAADPTTRLHSAAVLGAIGDPRAAPLLAWLASGAADERMRAVAADALDDLGPALERMELRTRHASTLTLEMVARWVRGDADVVRPYDAGQVAWRWADGSLVGEPILSGLYQLELAETTLSQARHLGGGQDMRAALAAVHAAMKAEIRAAAEMPGLQDSDLLDAAVARLPGLEIALARAGQARGTALNMLRSQDQPAAAAVLIETMGPSPSELIALQQALDSDYQAVSVAAALVLGTHGLSAADGKKVASVLGQALRSIPDRLVYSIGDSGLAGRAPGWLQLREANAAEGLMRAKQLPPKDVIVIRDGLDGMTLDTVVFGLLNDPRTADVPILIVTDEADLVGERYGDKVAGVLSQISFDDVEAVAGQVEGRAQKAAQRARAAAVVLSHLPASLTLAVADDVAQALERSGDDDVSIAVLGLAGHAGVALPQVEDFVLRQGSEALRIAALEAVAQLWARQGGASGAAEALRDGVEAALDEGGTGPLGLAAARALGQLEEGSPSSADLALADG